MCLRQKGHSRRGPRRWKQLFSVAFCRRAEPFADTLKMDIRIELSLRPVVRKNVYRGSHYYEAAIIITNQKRFGFHHFIERAP